MSRLTWKKPNGEWGLANGSLQNVPREYYGCMCKLKDYEETGLSPDQVKEISELYLEKCQEVNRLQEEVTRYKRMVEIYEEHLEEGEKLNGMRQLQR